MFFIDCIKVQNNVILGKHSGKHFCKTLNFCGFSWLSQNSMYLIYNYIKDYNGKRQT